jgi:flagellar motility protein MotE (MotC chaperone)
MVTLKIVAYFSTMFTATGFLTYETLELIQDPSAIAQAQTYTDILSLIMGPVGALAVLALLAWQLWKQLRGSQKAHQKQIEEANEKLINEYKTQLKDKQSTIDSQREELRRQEEIIKELSK